MTTTATGWGLTATYDGAVQTVRWDDTDPGRVSGDGRLAVLLRQAVQERRGFVRYPPQRVQLGLDDPMAALAFCSGCIDTSEPYELTGASWEQLTAYLGGPGGCFD